jgi:predicted DNA-binding transcriptional regulator AlpA
MTTEQHLTYADLMARFRLCRAKIFKLAKDDPDFPPRLRFGGRAIRFRLSDVLRYEEKLSGARQQPAGN